MAQILLWGSVWSMVAAGLSSQPLEVSAEKPFIPAGRPLAGLVITIDPGHGGSSYAEGYSGSARGVNSRAVEGDLNMLVAAELWHYLRRAGATVHMTRWDDRKVTTGETNAQEELRARVQKAVETRSHLFVSLHHNAAPRASADGVVVLIWPTDSAGREQPLERALEQCLREEVQKHVPQAEPFKPYIHEHALVAGSDIPSAVVEFGFLTNADFDAWLAGPGRHRDEARGVFNGIVRMWREHRPELEQLRADLFPQVARPEQSEDHDSTTQPWESAAAGRRSRVLHRSLWPFERPPASPAEMEWIIENYRRRVLSDTTFFCLETRVEKEGDGWRVHAVTNYPRLAEYVERTLNRLRCGRVRMDVTQLPSPRLGEKRYGVTQVPMAMTRAEPTESSGVQSQLLLGDRVFLLDKSEDGTYLLLQGPEGYVGWVREDAILRLDAAGFAEWENAPVATLRRDYLLDDFRLPAGSRLPVLGGGHSQREDPATADGHPLGGGHPARLSGRDARSTGETPVPHAPVPHAPVPPHAGARILSRTSESTAGARIPSRTLESGNPFPHPAPSNDSPLIALRLPRGVRATGGETVAKVPADYLRLPPETPPGREAARTAIEFLTAPYVFGARSRLGLDCSGLTGVSYATVGLALPRDARQQILVGQLVATPWHLDGLQPGDLVFFCDETGRVSHTGLSLGGMRFIHASAPEVQVSSFDPADPLYVQRWRERFAFARRPLP